MNILKKNVKLIAGILIGATLATGITAYATYSYFANNVSYTRNGTTMSVEQALDDLYDKANTDGYVAYFSGRSEQNTSTKSLPLNYVNNTYATANGNSITINKSGKYQVISTPVHCRVNYTTHILIYKNGTLIQRAYVNVDPDSGSYTGYNVKSEEFTFNEGDVINATYYSDGNDSNNKTTGGTVVIVKR